MMHIMMPQRMRVMVLIGRRRADVEPELDHFAVGRQLACGVVSSCADFPLSNRSG